MTEPRPRRRRRMTPEEYLAFEERARVRHEYVDGHVYAMSGTTIRHGRIVRNVQFRLHVAAQGGPCETFMQDLKVQPDATKFYYPDVAVVCTPQDDEAVVLTDPCLIVEVTSRSTRAVDHREKRIAYCGMPAVMSYLIVSHREQLVDRHWRDADRAWQHEVVTPESGGRVAVPCPAGVVLTLDQIYAGVTLPPRLRRLKEPTPPAYAAGPAAAGA